MVVIAKQNECHGVVTAEQEEVQQQRDWIGGCCKKNARHRAGQLEFWLGRERSCGVSTTYWMRPRDCELQLMGLRLRTGKIEAMKAIGMMVQAQSADRWYCRT
jgi:hypothetical protein